jgi:hypothetical protein
MKRFCFIASLHHCIAGNTMLIHGQKSPYNSAKLSNTSVKAKMTKFFGFDMQIMEMYRFFL